MSVEIALLHLEEKNCNVKAIAVEMQFNMVCPILVIPWNRPALIPQLILFEQGVYYSLI